MQWLHIYVTINNLFGTGSRWANERKERAKENNEASRTWRVVSLAIESGSAFWSWDLGQLLNARETLKCQRSTILHSFSMSDWIECLFDSKMAASLGINAPRLKDRMAQFSLLHETDRWSESKQLRSFCLLGGLISSARYSIWGYWGYLINKSVKYINILECSNYLLDRLLACFRVSNLCLLIL